MTGGSKLRRLLAVGFVLLLVVQASAPAAAQSSPETPEECDRGYLESTWQIITGTYDYNSGRCDEAQAHQNATHADLAASGYAMVDTTRATTTPLHNNLEYARTPVRAMAKAEAVRSFQNGSNQTVTEQNVTEVVQEYYANVQRNTLEAYNTSFYQMWYNYQAHQQEGLSVMDQEEHATESVFSWDTQVDSTGGLGTWKILNITVQLADGTNRTVPYYSSTDDTQNVWGPVTVTNSSWYTGESRYSVVYFQDPDTGSDQRFYQEYAYGRVFDRAESQSAAQVSNATAYVADLYSTYNSPEDLNVTEVIDPLTLAQEFNTNQNTTGSYGWQAAEIGLTGLEGTVNESFTIQYTPASNHTLRSAIGGLNGSDVTYDYRYTAGNTVNISGTFFTSWAPSKTNGSFVTGTTYNTANASSPVMFIAQTENGTHTAELDGEFTITELTDVTTGESLNETTLETQTQQTWNASFTREQMQSLLEYRDTVSGTYSTGGGGGGFNFGGWSLGGAAIGGLVALGIALVVLGNGNPLSGS